LNKIFFMPRQSRLAEEKSPVRLSSHSIAGPKKCSRDGHLNAGSSGFRRYTVLYNVYTYGSQICSRKNASSILNRFNIVKHKKHKPFIYKTV
jgi:hypothetical protein